MDMKTAITFRLCVKALKIGYRLAEADMNRPCSKLELDKDLDSMAYGHIDSLIRQELRPKELIQRSDTIELSEVA